MDYPEIKKPPFSKRILTVLIPIVGLGYYSNPMPLQFDGKKIADDLKTQPLLQELYSEELPPRDFQFAKIIHALMYGPEKITASSEIKSDRKKQWEIFSPIFENFSFYWPLEKDPMLINKKGHVPDSQSSEAFELFEIIKQRVDTDYFGFFSRLYINFLDLGVPPKDALKFIVEVERLNPVFPREKGVKTFFVGQNQPIGELEKMGFKKFVECISPYIIEKYTVFSRNLGMKIPADLPEYARMLSEDIFYSSKIFDVPLTSMLSISHQETYFMNIFGDGAKSVGPFQLYEPTRYLIEREMKEAGLKMEGNIRRLEDHITLSTFMAAFHFASLMKRYSSDEKEAVHGKTIKITVNLDKSLKLYNGHSSYPSKVFQKNQRLKYYLQKQKAKYAKNTNFLM